MMDHANIALLAMKLWEMDGSPGGVRWIFLSQEMKDSYRDAALREMQSTIDAVARLL